MFVGSIQEGISWEIHSEHHLESPFVVSSTRVLFVEVVRSRDNEIHKIMRIDTLNDEAVCHEVFRTTKMVLSPIMSRRPNDETITFITGDILFNSSGNRVPVRHMATLRDGKMETMKGAEFMSLSRISRNSKGEFLGVDAHFIGDHTVDIDKWIVEEVQLISVQSGATVTVPFAWEGIDIWHKVKVETHMESESVVFVDTGFPTWKRADQLMITNYSGELIKAMTLPVGYGFSTITYFFSDAGGDKVVMLAGNEGGEGFWVTLDMSNGEIAEVQKLDSTGSKTFETSNCRAP